MLVGAAVGGVASCLSMVNHYRQVLGPMTFREARQLSKLPVTPIAEAASMGTLVKMVGTVGTRVPRMSYYHRVPCAVLELRYYEVLNETPPRRVLLSKDSHLEPFWIEDDTGRLVINPVEVRIDFEVEGSELENTVEEHRIRVGERVVVLGRVRRVEPVLTQPMRQAPVSHDHQFEAMPGSLVSWRSEPEVCPRLFPPVGGMALSIGSIGLAVLGTILNL